MRTLYRAGRVLTLSYPATGDWVLVDDRHVERVGAGDPPSADRVVDLPGTTILPGFIDAHVHLTGTGIHEAGPRLGEVRSGQELLSMLSEAVAGDGRTGAFLAHGFDESLWPRRDLPSLADLDAATTRPLVVVRADGHISLANSAALEGSGALELPGGERDQEGRPTGVLRRKANDRAQRWFHESLAAGAIQRFQLEAAAQAASRGVTSVHEMSLVDRRGPRDFEVLMDHRERLPVDMIVYAETTNIPFVMDFGLTRIGGDLSLDGSIGAGTAYLSEPYADREGSGAPYQDTDELCEFFHNAHLANLQVAVHAIGDAAIAQAMNAWERVYSSLDSRERRHFRARRHRVEHFEMPTPDRIEQAAQLGLSISVQPSFDAAWGFPGGLYEQRLGEERAASMNPIRLLLDRGITVGAGSDSPITPVDPMAGISALERHHDVSQRLTREEAVRLFTSGSAALCHQEEKKGRLEPGAHADLAAYDEDPLAVDDPARIRPVLTVSLGREVYAR